MIFNLFGFDCISRDTFGLWLLSFQDGEEDHHRSLLCLYKCLGSWRIELFWFIIKY